MAGGMTAGTGDKVRLAGIDEVCRAASTARLEFSSLQPRLAELALQIEELEQAIVAHWQEIEFRLDEIEAELAQLTRPGWPF